MPREFSRSKRVADQIQREIAVLVQREIRDETLGMVTISNIDISPDLKNAKILFTCIGNSASTRQVSDKLNEHAGPFRHALAHVLTMRSVPKIHFEYDHTLDRANRLTSLIDSLHVPADPAEKNGNSH